MEGCVWLCLQYQIALIQVQIHLLDANQARTSITTCRTGEEEGKWYSWTPSGGEHLVFVRNVRTIYIRFSSVAWPVKVCSKNVLSVSHAFCVRFARLLYVTRIDILVIMMLSSDPSSIVITSVYWSSISAVVLQEWWVRHNVLMECWECKLFTPVMLGRKVFTNVPVIIHFTL